MEIMPFPRSLLMTKKIVKLIGSEDATNTADEAKPPTRKSRKSGTVGESTVSPEVMPAANVGIEPMNAEDAVSAAFVSTASDSGPEIGAQTKDSEHEVLAETDKVSKAAKTKAVKSPPVEGEVTSSERRSARGAYAIAQGLDGKNYKSAKITDAELDAFVLKIRKEAGDVLGKRSWQPLAKVVRGEIEAKDLAQPGRHPKEITASNKK
jgi:hypothetical protein